VTRISLACAMFALAGCITHAALSSRMDAALDAPPSRLDYLVMASVADAPRPLGLALSHPEHQK
jgi:hypothetical protein